jgi:cytochrome P450
MRVASTVAGSGSTARKLPPGPRLPGPAQTVWYTFAQPSFFKACRGRFGKTWALHLPGFPPIVVTADRDAVRRLFTGDPLLRRHGNDVLGPFFGERSLLLLEPREHLARRRLELPAFHGQAVRRYTERIRELVAEELAQWHADTSVQTQVRAQALTLSIILELVLGVRDARLREEVAAIVNWFSLPRNNLGLFLPSIFTRRAWWNAPARPAYTRLDRLHELLVAHIRRTREDSDLERREDVLALLVRARDEDGQAVSDADLRDELLTLITAGHETTATAIAWGCDLLAHNPAVGARLRETLADGDRDYLKAMVKEILRVRTVAYVAAGRRCEEPFSIGEWMLDRETLILVDAQGIHGDPELYPEPEAFRPERFLDAQPDGYSYIPFGGGAHRCLGAALATLELELFFEEAAQNIELRPVGPAAKPVRRGVTLSPGNKGLVEVKRVNLPQISSRDRPSAPVTA